jgi:hypothetical protein
MRAVAAHVVRSGTTWLAAMRVRDPQPVTRPDGQRPKQVHLDLAVADLDAAVAEARLGATQEHAQPAPDSWRVVRDPAGHVFCLSDRIPEYLPVDLEPTPLSNRLVVPDSCQIGQSLPVHLG